MVSMACACSTVVSDAQRIDNWLFFFAILVFIVVALQMVKQQQQQSVPVQQQLQHPGLQVQHPPGTTVRAALKQGKLHLLQQQHQQQQQLQQNNHHMQQQQLQQQGVGDVVNPLSIASENGL